MKNFIILFIYILFCQAGFSQVFIKEFKIEKQYLNFPIDKNEPRSLVKFVVNNDTLTYSVIRITDKKPDYWVFKDVAALKGKTLKLVLPKEVIALDQIYQSDTFAGEDSLYKEVNRPQFHFSTRRGWINDPNGLVYNNGE